MKILPSSTNKPIMSQQVQSLFASASFLTCGVGEVEDAGGRLQQVGAAGRQVPGDGHDGHTVATLLGAHDAVVLRLDHAALAAEQSGAGVGIRGSSGIKHENEGRWTPLLKSHQRSAGANCSCCSLLFYHEKDRCTSTSQPETFMERNVQHETMGLMRVTKDTEEMRLQQKHVP